MDTTSPTLSIRNKDLISYLGRESTRLTTASLATDTTLTVLDNHGLPQYTWLGIGEPGVEKSEIKMITGVVTAGTSLVTQSLTFPHPVDTILNKLPGDQVQFFYSQTKTSSKSSLANLQTIAIEDEYTQCVDYNNTSGYFWIKVYNSQLGKYVSDYIGPWSYAGLTIDSVGGIIETALGRENERISNLLPYDFLSREAKAFRKYMQQKMNVDLDISQDTSLSIVTGKYKYAIPAGIKTPQGNRSIIHVWLGMYGTLDMMNWSEWVDYMKGIAHTTTTAQAIAGATSITLSNTFELTAPTSGTASIKVNGQNLIYTTNTTATGVLSGIPASGTGSIATTIASGSDVYQGLQDGQPMKACFWSGYIYLSPISASQYNGVTLTIDYFKDDSDVLQSTDILDQISELGNVWMQRRINQRKGNNGLAESQHAEFNGLQLEYFGINDINDMTRFDSRGDNTYTT